MNEIDLGNLTDNMLVRSALDKAPAPSHEIALLGAPAQASLASLLYKKYWNQATALRSLALANFLLNFHTR